MTGLIIILAALLLCTAAAAIATLTLRYPVEDMSFAGDDIIIKTRPGRLPVYCRMKLTVTDTLSGETGELTFRSRLPEDGIVSVSSGAGRGIHLRAELCEVRARAAGSPFSRRFRQNMSCVRLLPPVKKVTLTKRDEASAAGAPEGVREFAHGDRLRDLHMKLSAKCGKYMVRERSGNMYAYSVTDAERKPSGGGRPHPEYTPSAEATGAAGVLCAVLAGMLWLLSARLITDRLPACCFAFGAAVMLIYLCGRLAKKGGAVFRALFYIGVLGSGAAGAPHLTSQLGRALNLVSDLATARFDRVFPLAESGSPDIFAACFLTAAALWAVTSAALGSRWVRYLAAALMLLPAVLLSDDCYALSAAVAAALLAAAPWRGFGFRGTLMPGLSAAAACVFFCTSAGTYLLTAVSESTDTLRFGGEISQPVGRISQVSQPSGDTPALEVVMDSPEGAYLHGFTGFDYDSGSWSAPRSHSISATQSQLKALDDSGFTADGQPLLLFRSAGSDVETQQVTMRTLGAYGRYAYLPSGAYTSCNSPAGLEVYSHGSTRSFEMVKDIFTAAEQMDAAAKSAEEEYIGCAGVMDDIYRSGYTRIPDSAERVLEGQLGKSSPLTADEAAAKVLSLLDGCTYDAEAEPQTAEDFLQTTRCGNSCAYASAAVLAFRYYGIPARYAEGYALTKDAAANAAAGSAVTLTADDFHAWAEYYVEGAGWLPFETVPGYTEKMPHTRGQGELFEKSGYGASGGEAADEQAGARVYDRMSDDDTKDEGQQSRIWIIPAAAAALFVLYIIFLMIRLETDPVYALSKCAAALRLRPDSAGRYDLSKQRGRCKIHLEQLEKICIQRVYSPHKGGRGHGAAAYLSCLTGGRKA